MRERPVDSLVSALRSLGGNISYIGKKGFPPLRINAHGLKGGYAKITGSGTSQGISSLLLSAPLSDRGITIEVTGEPVSKAYVDITCDVMKAFGIPVERDGYRIFSVVGATRYQACTFAVEGDASSASYFWAAAAVTGGKATTINLDPFSTRQGDAGFLEILKAMGADVQTENSSVTVTGGDLKGLELDMSSMPDLVPTLAAVAVFARGTTLIRNVAHLRIKESDRLASIAMEWKKLGASVEEFQDGLRIEGGRPLHGATLDPHDDHRLAMSLAVVSLRVPDIEILNRDCVEKSFPGFWGLWDAC
jgi:3-phosphoshikimate 1-carboxyvinyltransferase